MADRGAFLADAERRIVTWIGHRRLRGDEVGPILRPEVALTIPFLCVFAAWFSCWPPTWIVFGSLAKDGTVDNNHPRPQAATLTGWRLRSKSAHYNALEAFPGFAAAVLIAHVAGGDPTWLDRLAVAYVALRVLYIGLYVGNLATARSVVWTLALATNAAIFLLPALR